MKYAFALWRKAGRKEGERWGGQYRARQHPTFICTRLQNEFMLCNYFEGMLCAIHIQRERIPSSYCALAENEPTELQPSITLRSSHFRMTLTSIRVHLWLDSTFSASAKEHEGKQRLGEYGLSLFFPHSLFVIHHMKQIRTLSAFRLTLITLFAFVLSFSLSTICLCFPNRLVV